MSRKYFGTDGVRGRVGEWPICPEFMLRLGWAVGQVFGRSGRAKFLIGKDTRISGYMLESAIEAGIVAAGADVRLLGPMPTPAVAYLTRTFRAQAGIVISASHNPYDDNGVKFFSSTGSKLDDEVEQAIEAMLDQPMKTVSSAHLGKVVRIKDARGRYIEFCKSTVPSRLQLRGMKLVVDCAHGATYNLGPDVFDELGAEVIAMGTEPDGFNINDGLGSTRPEALQQRVLAEGADLGIAFDGDGDRVVFVDHRGELVDGDELLYVIAQDQQRSAQGCSGVAGTVMSNMGFELGLRELDIPFARANVGDRHVKELMRARQWLLGGESSGHIICADVTTTGDGIVAALRVLHAVVQAGMPLHELKQGFTKFPQVMENVRLERRIDAAELDGVQSAVREVEAELAGRGRVLLRPSGTEPVVRVMVEGEDAVQVRNLCRQLASVVQATLDR